MESNIVIIDSIDKALELYTGKFGPIIGHYGENIKVVCPSCGKKALFCHLIKGIVHCFACDYGSGLTLFTSNVLASGIQELESVVDEKTHSAVVNYVIDVCRLDEIHREYLRSRYILNPDKWGIKTVPGNLLYLCSLQFTEDELVSSGLFYRGASTLVPCSVLGHRRILIPYWEGDHFVTVKSRANPYSLSNEIKYFTSKGVGIGGRIFRKDLGNSGDLLVVEGEFKAIVANDLGFNTVAIGGLSGFHSRKVRTQLRKIAKGFQRIFMIPDCDVGYRQDTAFIDRAQSFCSWDSRVALVLLDSNDREKVDLDQYLLMEGDQRLTDMLEDAWGKRKRLGGLI